MFSVILSFQLPPQYFTYRSQINILNFVLVKSMISNRNVSRIYVFTLNFLQNSTELQDDSSKGMLGSMSSLTLTVEEDEVKTTRLSLGFFLQDLNTFKVPSTAGFKISTCSMDN